jgi:MFS family permease
MTRDSKDRKNLLRNGIWWSAADAFTTPFIVPFALALGATNMVVGLINSLQNLGLLASQVPGSELVWVLHKRRALNNACEFIAKSSWLLIVAVPFLPQESWMTVLMVSVALSSFFVNMSYPAWSSFIADVIPKRIRARYLGNRNMWMGIVSIAVMLFVGFYLDWFPNSVLGFSSIFLFGFIAGMVSIAYFARIRGSKLRLPEHHFRDYFRVEGNFRAYLIFLSYFNFTYMIASPFFTVYMLQDLAMGYGDYVLFCALAAFAGLASQRHWGKIVDRFGDRPTMFIAIIGGALVPLFFIFINPSNVLFLIPIQILSGVAWAGVWLVNFNMFLDTTQADRRIVQTADYNIITTIPLIIAPLVGGYIAENASFVLSGIPLLFFIAALLRFSSLPLLGRIKEPHVKEDYPPGRVFQVFTSVHPVRGFMHEIKAIDRAIVSMRRKGQ